MFKVGIEHKTPQVVLDGDGDAARASTLSTSRQLRSYQLKV
jgi:hypothetical protein